MHFCTSIEAHKVKGIAFEVSETDTYDLLKDQSSCSKTIPISTTKDYTYYICAHACKDKVSSFQLNYGKSQLFLGFGAIYIVFGPIRACLIYLNPIPSHY